MTTPKFRLLTPSDIEVRAQTVRQNGCILLLYKDARVDQRILDQTVGPMNWQREHSRDNANCTVSIWDEAKKIWIRKEDTGTESQAESKKGLASDSFKRACFNWGIGRELYTAPFIWVSLAPREVINDKDRHRLDYRVKFSVSHIEYEQDSISHLVIVDQDGVERFRMADSPTPQQIYEIKECFRGRGLDHSIFFEKYKIKKLSDLSMSQASDLITELSNEEK